MTDRPVALITGAARGIGAATARRLAAAGWAVTLVDRAAPEPGLPYPLATAADLDDTAAGCVEAAGADRVLAVTADVRRQEALDRAVAATVERFGGLDAALGMAGAVAGGEAAWRTDDAVWRLCLEVNLEGVWRLVRAAVPALLARPQPRRGRVVAVTSTAGLGGLPRLAAYSAAKHGVIGLVRSLAADLAGTSVTANAVCPGSTRTAMLAASADIYGLGDVEEFARHHLLGRLLETGEVAEAAVWLCSEAASGVTGTVLTVDAGMTAVPAWGQDFGSS